MTRPARNILRKILIIVAALTSVLAILAAPYGIFWLRWWNPTTEIPRLANGPTESVAGMELAPGLEQDFLEVLAEARRTGSMPAISAAIGQNGQMVWAGTNGFADIGNGTPARTGSLFRLGSTSKPITATILARLHQRGMIDLDAGARTLAPDLPPAYQEVTIRRLASHTGGVRHYRWTLTWFPSNLETLTSTHYESVKEGLEIFVDDPLEFEPGTEFNYSTYGYSLLSYLIERSAGVPFGTLVESEINQAAGVSVRFDNLREDIPARVAYYLTKEGKYTPAYPADPSNKWAGGGLIANPGDLVRLGMRILDDDYLSPTARDQIWTPVALPGSDTNPQNYGLGWRIDSSLILLGEDRPVRIIHHGGRQLGGVAFWSVLPDYGISVAAAANTENRDARNAVQDATFALARALLEAGER
jgi:CubicO group peptidase (beta-lactamase class C family)